MNTSLYQIHAINWDELAAIGIDQSFLHENGQLNALLSGEATEPLPLQLTLLSVPVCLDAQLKLEENPDGKVRVVIDGMPWKTGTR